MLRLCLLGAVLLLDRAAASSGCVIPGELEEKWGYVDVRTFAHQFWWFMKTPCEGAETKPIVIWLQGGPGGSGTGYGNFMEIGPIDNNKLPRNYTWLKEASLLFIDSPVGAGFSYVDTGHEDDGFTRTVYEVADDLVTTLAELDSSGILAKHYRNGTLPPIYIFSESYGGKVAPVFGAKIVEAQAKGYLAGVVLGGVAIGDGAVSLLDAGMEYPGYLYQTSQIDFSQYSLLQSYASEMEASYLKGDFNTSSMLLGVIMEYIVNSTDEVFFYNIMYHHQPSPSLMKPHRGKAASLRHPMQQLTIDYNGDNVKKLMNTEMRKKFGVIPAKVKWGGQALECHSYLADEMIIDVIDSVDECLDKGVRVIVYNGMLDFIINSAGQERWMQKLKWKNLLHYYQQERVPLYPPSEKTTMRTGAFFKSYKNFQFYWILMSGHMVPIDVPEMSLEMVRRIITNEQYA